MDETIAAIATAVGEASLGVVRLSGPRAIVIADQIFRRAGGRRLTDAATHTVQYGWIVDPATGADVDEALATIMRAPKSYTREDVVELSGHGGVVTVRRVLAAALAAGARLAEPGEFTQRAFLNGRIDLAQAEAVLQLIRATHDGASTAVLQQLRGGLSARLQSVRERLLTTLAHLEVHVDFPGEEHAIWSTEVLNQTLASLAEELARWLAAAERNRTQVGGCLTVICGRPNVGKSSLLNALLRRDRAIVTPIPGTTRDTLEELVMLEGLPLRLVDTAGVTDSADPIERAGVQRSREALACADLALWVVDGSEPLTPQDLAVAALVQDRRTIVAMNKADLPARLTPEAVQALAPSAPVVSVAARDARGLEVLEAQLLQVIRPELGGNGDVPLVTHLRHQQALRETLEAVRRARVALDDQVSPDLVAVEVREALDQLGMITGETANDELLATIFSQFCIGK